MEMSIRISRRAADRLRAGHLWVYRSELLESGGTAGEPAKEALQPGMLVTVDDSAGRPLGTALYSSSSEIALRRVSLLPGQTRAEYLADLRTRVAEALALRTVVAPLSTTDGRETTAQRLLFSEADGVPGIVADRYANLVIVQLLTQGTAQDDVRAVLVESFVAGLGAEGAASGEPLTIWERPDPRIRELEQLPAPPEAPLFTAGPDTAEPSREAATHTVFLLNGLRFGYDVTAGQKTGAFLDQRLNYAAAAKWVERSGHTRHALDVCTYHGGFALHLAAVCARVTGVDQSRAALEAADSNLARNPQVRGEVDWIEADAFALLRALDEAGRENAAMGRGSKEAPGHAMGLPKRFDAIVLDPPAFAKSKRAAEGALRGYKELNLRAMRLLAPGGTLVTCSCSHHISLEAFLTAVTEAAQDAGRQVQLLESRAAAPDHPEVLTLPETRYLKCLICRVV